MPRRLDALAAWLTARYPWVLAGIVLLGAVLRVAVYFDLQAADPAFHEPGLDSGVFLRWAGEIAGGNVLGDRPFFLNPLYPYLLSPVVALFPDDPVLVIRILQGLVGLGSVLLIATATRRFLGPVHALGAALIAATYPVTIFYEQQVMIVAVAVFLNALTLVCLGRLADRPTLLRAAVAGIPLGLAVLARPNVGLFALLLPIWLLRLGPTGGRVRFAAVRTAALFAGIVVVVLPVTARNAVVGKDFVPVTTSMGINLWQCNNPEAWETGRMTSREVRFNPRFVETDAIAVAERNAGRPLAPSEFSKYWQRRTLRTMGENPGTAAGYLVRKAVYFLNGFEPPSSQYYEMRRTETSFLRFLPLSFWILSPLALAGAILVLLRKRDALPFVLLYVAYWAGLTIFFPLGHYRAPVLPAVFPLATLAIGAILTGPRRSVAIMLIVLAALLANGTAVASVFGVPRLPRNRAEKTTWHYNNGLSLLRRGDLEGAEEKFRRAREENPASWLVDMGFAHLARARGDRTGEEVNLRHVLDKVPGQPTARGSLGANLFHRGRRTEGMSLVEAAVRDDPRDPALRAIYADLLMATGRPAEALVQLEAEVTHGRPGPDNLGRQVWCLRRIGRKEEAARRVERGLRLFPGSPPLHFEHARLLVDTSAPRDRIRAAVRSGVFRRVSEVLEVLTGLEQRGLLADGIE
ncbi:MAG: glycosyltransferase family 39 protein, partial [Planctomycetota bacterium]